MIGSDFNCPNCNGTIHDIVAEGWTAYQCNKCGLPFVAKTVMVPTITTHKIVGFENIESEKSLPTPEEIEEDARYYAEHPEELDEIENQSLPNPTESVIEWLQCPDSKNSVYRLDGDHVEVKYMKGAPIKTTWSDIYVLCEEENSTASIRELLGERANTNNVTAVNALVRAVKAGKIEV